MRYEGGGPQEGISALIRRDQRACFHHPPTPIHTRTQREGQEESPHHRETKPASTVLLDFAASRIVRKKVLLFKPPSLWYFAMAAGADRHSCITMGKPFIMWTIFPPLTSVNIKRLSYFPNLCDSMKNECTVEKSMKCNFL